MHGAADATKLPAPAQGPDLHQNCAQPTLSNTACLGAISALQPCNGFLMKFTWCQSSSVFSRLQIKQRGLLLQEADKVMTTMVSYTTQITLFLKH